MGYTSQHCVINLTTTLDEHNYQHTIATERKSSLEWFKLRKLKLLTYIFSVDHSLVKLIGIEDEPGSDFINANYIPVSGLKF